eukprot:TRINITY_DN5012_c0_g1_i1.p1 TRINITY_DN5012_c0_g1~~TRINITY_DN5012_c0_g1_i1.p1  ORF type:complete len:308 (+),score=57.06 TRINITY_DN5012_c0_g1_i1:101-1024(+)
MKLFALVGLSFLSHGMAMQIRHVKDETQGSVTNETDARFEIPDVCQHPLQHPNISNAFQDVKWIQCGKRPSMCTTEFVTSIILFGGQTGTTHLSEDFFQLHPEIMWVPEGNDACFLEMLRRGVAVPKGKRVVATKSQSMHLIPDLEAQIPSNSRFIHVTRLNTIAWGLSKYHKMELKACLADGDADEDECVGHIYGARAVSVEELQKSVDLKTRSEKQRTETLHHLESRGFPVLHLSYESLLENEPVQVRRMTDFLKIAPREVEAKVEKFGSPELRESFSNWNEVVEAFCGTELEPMLSLKDGESCP